MITTNGLIRTVPSVLRSHGSQDPKQNQTSEIRPS